MTYCVAIALDEGLVFCSDSRTNAGPDRVSKYSKMHRYFYNKDRVFVILSAGNLATSQAVMSEVQRDLEQDEKSKMLTTSYVSDIAEYLGGLLLKQRKKYEFSVEQTTLIDAGATLILGGQIRGRKPELYMIYPEGNFIIPPETHPYLQIGETKYGKPILDRIIRKETSHDIAMKCALVSIDSTMRSSGTVGPPIECLFYRTDSLQPHERYFIFEESNSYLVKIRTLWDESIREAFSQLPNPANDF